MALSEHELELCRRVEGIHSGELAWDMLDWTDFSEGEQNTILLLVNYFYSIRAKERENSQKKAMVLLRSWLTWEERRELSRHGCVTLTGSLGGRYRIWPEMGTAHKVQRHGKREFWTHSCCIHPDNGQPPADDSLAHYLLLKTDEARFLEIANLRPSQSRLWDGEYLKRMRHAKNRTNL